jgi:hypothetical protein
MEICIEKENRVGNRMNDIYVRRQIPWTYQDLSFRFLDYIRTISLLDFQAVGQVVVIPL